jgi:hypothetical protein
VTQEASADAIKAALTAALPGDVTAYDLDEVPEVAGNPGVKPLEYVLVFVSRRWVPERRASGEVDLPGGRLTVRYHSATYIDNAREYRRITLATLEDQILTLGDDPEIGPFVFEVEDPIREIADSWTGADTLTF